MQGKNPFIGQLITTVIIFGAVVAVQRWTAVPSVNIENNYGTILNAGKNLSISPDELKKTVESIPNKIGLATNAVRIISPAKSDPNAKIIFDNTDTMTVTPEVIRDVPAVPHSDTEETEKTFTNVPIIIRALDFDSRDKGWSGIIPDISDKRIKIQLDRNIQPISLFRGLFCWGAGSWCSWGVRGARCSRCAWSAWWPTLGGFGVLNHRRNEEDHQKSVNEAGGKLCSPAL